MPKKDFCVDPNDWNDNIWKFGLHEPNPPETFLKWQNTNFRNWWQICILRALLQSNQFIINLISFAGFGNIYFEINVMNLWKLADKKFCITHEGRIIEP